ncbi:unnamed protein product [marine sediment metagenome]|uniref:Uncharacterized protein n=1 Tax=marine sediment metagenome TaxID=412755 RepID=X0Z2S5_9ZZZZ
MKTATTILIIMFATITGNIAGYRRNPETQTAATVAAIIGG